MTHSEEILSIQVESWADKPDKAGSIVLEGETLVLEDKLRYLPKRRLTCRAKWKNKTVIAKLFYGERSRHYAHRESSALDALKGAGIKAPELVHITTKADVSIVIISYIEESMTLLQWLSAEPDQKQFELALSKASELLLACHQAGLEISDPHLDNFLICHDDIYIVDAGDIQRAKNPLNSMSSIKNMALFYAQFPISYDVIAYKVLTMLLQKDKQENVLTESIWQQLLIKQRCWRQKKFIDKKVFRECSAYICKHDRTRFMILKRDAFSNELESALSKPDVLIQNGKLLKDGGTATVALIEVAGMKYVLKRYNIKKPIHAVIRGFMWSRAAISWKNGLLLEMLGIPTAKSYAMIEERWGPLRRRSYLLSEYIDAPQAWDVFNDENMPEEVKAMWAKRIYDLFELLKRSQISHGDLKAQNILCPDEGALFIDLDGLLSDQGYKRFLRQFKKDIHRFQISWPSKWQTNPYFNKFEKLLIGNKPI